MEEEFADSWPSGFPVPKAKGGGVCRWLLLAWVPRVFPAAVTEPSVLEGQIEGNRKRDRLANGRLRRLGWKVIRIRECQLKNPENVLRKINRWLIEPIKD